MEAGLFDETISQFQRRVPFRPFGVHLVNGQVVAVDHPEALVARAGMGVYVDRHGLPTIFDHEGVCEIKGSEVSPGDMSAPIQ